MASMKQRHLVPEQMDNPDLDPREHQRALAGLRRINWFSGTASQLQKEFLRIAASRPQRHWEILDVGCANGEVAFELASRLRGKLDFTLTGWDMSPVAIASAEARRAGELQHSPVQPSVTASGSPASCLRFKVRNLFDELERTAGQPQFDIIYCTLLLHHFSDEDAIRVLAAMRQLARHAVIVDDLRRTRLGWLLAVAGCHLLSRSPVVHFDGPQSVRAAFSSQEALRMANTAGLNGATLRHHWPERFQLCWEAPQ
jgi:2-polyprenyl-3-methyl-5-hydroxy-6-metoxy-1,4-benzoquinol methylase